MQVVALVDDFYCRGLADPTLEVAAIMAKLSKEARRKFKAKVRVERLVEKALLKAENGDDAGREIYLSKAADAFLTGRAKTKKKPGGKRLGRHGAK